MKEVCDADLCRTGWDRMLRADGGDSEDDLQTEGRKCGMGFRERLKELG